MSEPMEEKINFVIVSIPRSGSNYLCGMLNSHPEILCHHELYHSSAIYYALDHRKDLDLGDVAYRNGNPHHFLSSVWAHRFSARAVGFKIFPGHNDLLLDGLLADRSVKKIILERPNLLSVFVSKLVAERTGIYSSLQGAAQVPENVTVDVAEFKGFVAEVEQYFAECKKVLAQTGQSYLTVSYPGILDADEMLRILDYLQVSEECRLSTPHQKQGNYLLRQMIRNYSEVSDFLDSANLSHYLEENGE